MKKTIGLLILTSFLISGCTSTGEYAAGGALAGGALGAAIGHNAGSEGRSGKRDKGALIGAVVGALAGTAIGQAQEIKRNQSGEATIVVCPSCESRIDVTGFPPHATVQCPNCKSQFTF